MRMLAMRIAGNCLTLALAVMTTTFSLYMPRPDGRGPDADLNTVPPSSSGQVRRLNSRRRAGNWGDKKTCWMTNKGSASAAECHIVGARGPSPGRGNADEAKLPELPCLAGRCGQLTSWPEDIRKLIGLQLPAAPPGIRTKTQFPNRGSRRAGDGGATRAIASPYGGWESSAGAHDPQCASKRSSAPCPFKR